MAANSELKNELGIIKLLELMKAVSETAGQIILVIKLHLLLDKRRKGKL